MRHMKSGRKLGRNASHRAAMKKNMAASLFEHESIITTVAKAKELRPFAERLITLAKKNTLHNNRLVVARLGSRKMATKLFEVIGPRFADRPGGYTRIIKRMQPRLGDAGPTAILELVKESSAPATPAPAPKVEASNS